MKLFNSFKSKVLRKIATSLKPYILEQDNEILEIYHKFSLNTILGKGVIFSKTARVDNNLNNRSSIKIGNNCLIYGQLLTYKHGGFIQLGDYVFIGENSRIWSSINVTIGNYVLISHNVNIHDNNSHPLNAELRRKQIEIILTSGLPDQSYDTREKPIFIEDDVWIGFNVSINKGVKIGKGAIVAANSVVFDDVPAYSIVMGNPAKVVSRINNNN